MPAKIIDGNAAAEQIRKEIAEEVYRLSQSGRPVKLVAVQVGDDPASKLYTDMQARDCESVGIAYELKCLPADIDQAGLEAEIGKLNADPAVSGLILQMPLPDRLNAPAAQMAISPAKDVEGIHPENLGRLFGGTAHVAPCTPMAAIELLTRTCQDLGGKEVVVVGRSDIVGKPMAALLMQKGVDATVTVCHSRTKNIGAVCREADIVVAALGIPEFVRGDMIKPGAVVIDVGINRVGDRLVGDVHYDEASRVASAITPVPGGVGPMTIAMLLENTLKAARDLAVIC